MHHFNEGAGHNITVELEKGKEVADHIPIAI